MTQMDITAILTSPLALVLLGYVGLMIVLALLVQPLRLTIFRLGDELLGEERWSEGQREDIIVLMEYAYAFRAGFLMPLAILAMTIDLVLDQPRKMTEEQRQLACDDRFTSMLWRFFASIGAANPIAAIVSLVFMAGFALLTLALHATRRSLLFTVVEEPAFRVIDSVTPGRRFAGH